MEIYIQKDGMTMGQFGDLFFNLYMSPLENKVFDAIDKPNIYLI